jgi:hypothetical protein
MDKGNKKEKQKILKSKPTPLSKGKIVPSTVYGGLDNAYVNKKVERRSGKKVKLGSFKPIAAKGTKTPFGLKKLPCRPVFHYQTPKNITDNTRSKSEKYKPKGFPTEKFLSFPRNDFVM